MSEVLTLATENETVVLRQLTLEDAPAYFGAVDNNREHLSQFGDGTAAKYPDLASVEASITNPSNPDKLRFGVWDDTTFVGSINLTPDEEGAEIGYWVDGRYGGKGYATLATKALAGFAKGKYPRVFADVVEGNTGSSRVLEKSGFKQTAKKAGKLIFELI